MCSNTYMVHKRNFPKLICFKKWKRYWPFDQILFIILVKKCSTMQTVFSEITRSLCNRGLRAADPSKASRKTNITENGGYSFLHVSKREWLMWKNEIKEVNEKNYSILNELYCLSVYLLEAYLILPLELWIDTNVRIKVNFLL